MNQLVLLNPGPVNLTPRVRSALSEIDLCHREPEFDDLQRRVRHGLLDLYGLAEHEYQALLLTGSGTAAVEAMLTTLVPESGRLLVVSNGVYGERLAAIAAANEIDHEVVTTKGWGDVLPLTELERRLGGDPRAFTHLAVVQHETTTGRLNDLAALSEICRASGTRLLVDAVSSFGAEHLDFEGWGIDACAVSANKCLHGAPGVAMVITSTRALDEVRDEPPRSVVLDLRRYASTLGGSSIPFTPAVHVMVALEAALAELRDAGGVAARQATYEARARRLRLSMSQLGVRSYLEEGSLASSLTAFWLPTGMTYDDLHDALHDAGFVIYAGQGSLAPRIFRIANMGDLSDEQIERFLEAFERVAC